MPAPTITRLRFEDEQLAEIQCPKRLLRISRGLGSGLTRSSDGRLFAIGDRGPNLKVKLAVETYGLEAVKEHGAKGSAKVMPALEIGPALVELRLDGDRVELIRTAALHGDGGKPLTGLPPPGSDNSRMEPAVRMDGTPLAPDPGGVDSEGIAIAADGTIWIGDEYGPSLLQINANGMVRMRWVPAGAEATVAAAPYPSEAVLPALAARRQVNRGFEAIALSKDGTRLHLAFQSPLAHPDVETHSAARHVRLWTLDTSSGSLLAQYLYELDEPATFARDLAQGPLQRSDIKVSEMLCVGERRLLILERASQTTKLYVVELDEDCVIPNEHAEEATRPTIEQMSAAGELRLPVLKKRPVLNTDDHPQVSADLEGMALLDPATLLLVNDNDFGIEDVETAFWLVRFDDPIA
ncbi:MAG: esterase-like activity of phytase family protein [Pseudomonadota bacterium]|nr:esterase-like activity of phytase family protein [Sphingomonas sp.]MDQ3478469.1 esterase-like activity of phytase family protein [Pseudomonadota bacterium]